MKHNNYETRNATKISLRFSTVLLSLTASFLMNFLAVSQNIGINNSGALADPSAMLDVNSTEKGFLMPRMTTVQRDAIVNPASGLMVYNTDTDCLELHFGGGQWQSIECKCTVPNTPTHQCR